MSEKTQGPQPEGNARRKLVRGVFAVPAVLTLSSGSAFAAASSLSCIQANPVPSLFSGSVAPTSDTIYRIRVYQATDTKYYVKGSDVPAPLLLKAVSGFMTASQAWQFLLTNATTGLPVSVPSGLVPKDYWAALRFDASGNLVGVGAGTGYALTGSCWNSFG